MTLTALEFDNRFTTELPADPVEGGRSRQVPGAAFSRVTPVTTTAPHIIAWSRELSDQLGFDPELWSTEEAAEVFTGNRVLPGSDPHAANYAGHQFGNFAGQLGDGRAISLGEIIDRNGDRQTLQLKGAGPTPYSRRADGLAVLRSSVREYLCSEAMFHLGVPTTRALSLALTGTEVVRDMFYDGNPKEEPGAIVCRVAPSFLRFGSYQLFTWRQELDNLRTLADFTLRHYVPHLWPSDGKPGPETYAAWFAEVCETTRQLMVEWMRVGFVHGVMNTDNMSIHGLTIDYGPYGWVDDFDLDWTPNTTDAGGRRYRFGWQPRVAQWNLLQLANALYPLVGETEALEGPLNDFVDRFNDTHRAMMLSKLGLEPSEGADGVAADEALIADLVEVLQQVGFDMTIFFRRLATAVTVGTDRDGKEDGDDAEPQPIAVDDGGLGDALYRPLDAEHRQRLDAWLDRYRARLRTQSTTDAERAVAMNAVNPRYVLRNYLAQLAIDAAEGGEYGLIEELASVLRRPYDDQPGVTFDERRPDWAMSRPGCSMLSCSS